MDKMIQFASLEKKHYVPGYTSAPRLSWKPSSFVTDCFRGVLVCLSLHICSSSGTLRSLIFYTTRLWLIHIIFASGTKRGGGKTIHTHTLDRPGNTYVLTLLHPLQICVNYMHILYAYLHRIIFSVFTNYRTCMKLLRCLFQTMTDVHRTE